MTKLRTCLVCGAKYKYCNSCGDYNPTETWRFLAHDNVCYDIYKIWHTYHSGELTQEEFKEKLKGFDLTTTILNSSTPTMIGSQIQAAFAEPKVEEESAEVEEVKEPEKSTEVVESLKKAEEFMDVQKKQDNPQNHYHSKKKK